MADVKKLPEDVLIEILLSLPVKSLLRFRCVSKQWFNLIKSPEFVDLHLNHNKQETVLAKRVIVSGQDGRSFFSFHSSDESLSVVSPEWEIPDMDYTHDFTGSYNGLVFITTNGRGIFVFNPALRQLRRIPSRPFGFPEGIDYHWDNALFGFDPKTKSWKVVNQVKFPIPRDPEAYYEYDPNDLAYDKVELYDLKNDSWREINIDNVVRSQYVFWKLYFNGVFHWVTTKNTYDFKLEILFFDMSNETFGNMDFPDEIPSGYQIALFVLRDCLAAVRFEYGDGDYQQMVEIWVMKEYGVKESWVREYVLGPLIINRPLCFLKDERLLCEGTNGKMVSCVLDTNEVRELGISGFVPLMQVVNYKESLVSVDSLFKGPN